MEVKHFSLYKYYYEALKNEYKHNVKYYKHKMMLNLKNEFNSNIV
jgi:hypothetical protein